MNAPFDRSHSIPSPGQALRKLFLTQFLRGRSARGLQKENAPKSLGSKLVLTLLLYALLGMLALAFLGQPLFALAVYLHAMTLGFLGMFVASSAGEVLFNKEEADILLHRPVDSRSLLWAKITVLLQVSLWLAGAFNLVGLLMGIGLGGSGWLFPLIHAVSTVLEALFTTGSVVLVYQLCLRWFGRERLDALMTTAQVVTTIAIVVASQTVPYFIQHLNGRMTVRVDSWWIWLVPPAWFAGFDDALAGSGAVSSWAMAALAMIATGLVLFLAFGRLADEYQTGLQMLNESVAQAPSPRPRFRWLDVLVRLPPLRFFLRDSVTRASFLLTAAYLVRDRDVKLRIYPGIAPMLVMPLIFLFQERGQRSGVFGVAFVGTYLGLIPLLALNLLQYSQQWQAADIFRAAPMPGPAPLSDGARQAVLWILTVPVLGIYGLILCLLGTDLSRLVMLLPGLIALPVYSLVPCLGGKGVPLSLPNEEAKSASRGLQMIAVMLISFALSGLAMWAWSGGWFVWLLLIEAAGSFAIYTTLRAAIATGRWSSQD